MTLDQILDLDYRKVEDAEEIQKELKKIKPLSKCKEKEVPLTMIEKLIYVLSKRYKVGIVCVECDIWSKRDSIIWRVKIVLYTSLESNVYIHGISLYEAMVKTVLYMYQVKDKVGRWGENK